MNCGVDVLNRFEDKKRKHMQLRWAKVKNLTDIEEINFINIIYIKSNVTIRVVVKK